MWGDQLISQGDKDGRGDEREGRIKFEKGDNQHEDMNHLPAMTMRKYILHTKLLIRSSYDEA